MAAWLTVWEKADEALPVKLPSPRYCTVIECDPTARAEEVNEAVPVLSRVSVSSSVVPSKNSTEPVGVPPPGATGDTVAVKVTIWP